MLTYGIIVSGAGITRWQMECIELLRQSRLAQLRCIVNDGATAPSRSGESLYAGIACCTRSDAATLCTGGDAVSWHEINAARDISPPLPPRLDFLLLFGERSAATSLIDAARYGVWYFVRSDLTKFTTTTPGFWEVLNGHNVTGAFLLQMRNDGSAGAPLKSAFLPTRSESLEANVEAQLAVCVKWPLHVCWDIMHGAAAYFDGASVPLPAAHYGIPSRLQIMAARWRAGRARTACALRLNCSSIEWRIARIDAAPEDFIGGERTAKVSYVYPREKSRYFADPCIVTRGGGTYLFSEEYRAKENIGVVAVSQLRPDRPDAPQAAIVEAHHLSYPHVFEHDGVTYCVPESGGIRKVCLYRSVDFPAKWEYVQTLIDGFEAADSTLVQYRDRWWLFCTSSEAAPRGNYSHLYIWHASDLFGTWTPHVRNPVKIDARSARPAGRFFTHKGALYRPAQDCSRSYGGAVVINRIDELSETAFCESIVGAIRPPRWGYTKGLHTISAAGDWCVVDVRRYVISPTNMAYAFRSAVRRGLERLGAPEHLVAQFSKKRSCPDTAPATSAVAEEQ
jgi:hypothetical protein